MNREISPLFRVLGIFAGLALVGAGLCAWHYWHISPVAAGFLCFVGVLYIGTGVDGRRPI